MIDRIWKPDTQHLRRVRFATPIQNVRAGLASGLLSFVLIALGLQSTTDASASRLDRQIPAIHCAWAMANTSATDTFEYGPDDNTSTSLLGTEPACKLDPLHIAVQAMNAPGMLVLQGSNPKPREIELWAAVSQPNGDAFASGLGKVSWTVLKPNGDLLEKVENPIRTCAGTSAPGPMWDTVATAYSYSGTGAFSSSTVSNETGTGLWQACRQGQIRIFSARAMLPANAPCGSYSITTLAAVQENTSTLEYEIEVLCPVSARMDASDIHWDVTPGGTAIVRGDLDPSTSDSPTITNHGDRPIQVGVVFSALRRSDLSDSIAEFGATVQGRNGSLEGLPRLAANTDGWMPGLASVVCPGKSIPINLVVHAPIDLAPGEYSGSVRVLARAGGRC
jgi:hypothetical protein